MIKKLVIFLFLSIFSFGFLGCNVVNSVTTSFDKPGDVFSFCSVLGYKILSLKSTESSEESFDAENLITLNKFVNLFDEFLGGDKSCIIESKNSEDKDFSQQTKIITQEINLGTSFYNLFYNEKTLPGKMVADSNKEKEGTTISGKIKFVDKGFDVEGEKTINLKTTNYSVTVKESLESYVKVSAVLQKGEGRYFVEKQKDGVKELYFEFEINVVNSDTTLNLVLPEGEDDVEYKLIKKKAHELGLEITETKNEESSTYIVTIKNDRYIYKKGSGQIVKKRMLVEPAA